MTVKVCPPLVPPAVVTVTVWAPAVAAAAITMLAVSDVALLTTTLATVTPPLATVTVVAPTTKLVPVSVTATVVPGCLDSAHARQRRRGPRRLRVHGRRRHDRVNRRQHRRGHAATEQPPPGGRRSIAARLDRQFQQVKARELRECQVNDRIGLGGIHLPPQGRRDRRGARRTVTPPPDEARRSG